MLKKQSVFLCVPSGDGYEHCKLSHYIDVEIVASGHRIVQNRQVARPTDYSRNMTVETFMTHPDALECDWYYTIDSDTVPPIIGDEAVPEGALNRLLLRHLEDPTRKVICGVTYANSSGMLWMPIMGEKATGAWSPQKDVYQQPTYPFVKVDGAGAACMLVHREVIEKVHKRFGVVWKDHYHEGTGKRTLGQDLDFSRKIRACGYAIYADMDVVCDHFKEVNLKDIAGSMLDTINVLRLLAQGGEKYFGSVDKMAEAFFGDEVDLGGLKELVNEGDPAEKDRIAPGDREEVRGKEETGTPGTGVPAEKVPVEVPETKVH